jgi:ubiquinone/menaquinone biosynthesis C-methylase UbiE
MCQQAQARLLSAGLSARALPFCGDAVYLPFHSVSLDAIFMAFTLELFDTPEIPLVLAACRRVLRPGGRLGVVAMAKSEGRPGWMLRVYEWMHTSLPNLVDCRPIYVEEAVTQSGFLIYYSNTRLMWGLPVSIVIGSKE